MGHNCLVLADGGAVAHKISCAAPEVVGNDHDQGFVPELR